MSKRYDAIIVGGGPAGLSAAIYLSRAKYSVLVLEKEKFGGQITITSQIVNYPGVLEDSGEGLTDKMRQQAESFGAVFQKTKVKKMFLDQPVKRISMCCCNQRDSAVLCGQNCLCFFKRTDLITNNRLRRHRSCCNFNAFCTRISD